jgi:hypothetical protein
MFVQVCFAGVFEKKCGKERESEKLMAELVPEGVAKKLDRGTDGKKD